MKLISLTSVTIFLLLIGTTLLNAQSGTVATGGEGSGTGGEFTYTTGLIFYSTIYGASGSAAEGLQHPHELMQNSPTCPGDSDGNGLVNILDLIAVSGNFGCTENCAAGDANFDGVVNILDLIVVSSNFGSVCS